MRKIIGILSLMLGLVAAQAQIILLNDTRYAAQGLAGLSDTLGITLRTFAPEDCSISEGCNAGGDRRLITFAQVLVNIGTEDSHLPTFQEHPELFEFDPCHGHIHVSNWSLFELIDCLGVVRKAGGKRGWCVVNSIKVDPDAGPPTNFSCLTPGLSPGWADRYGQLTTCQWLDVTDIPDGNYIFRAWVDPLNIFGIQQYVEQPVQITGNVLVKIPALPPCLTPTPLAGALNKTTFRRNKDTLTVSFVTAPGATITGSVNFPAGPKAFVVTARVDGKISYTVNIRRQVGEGSGTVTATAIADRYAPSGVLTLPFNIVK